MNREFVIQQPKYVSILRGWVNNNFEAVRKFMNLINADYVPYLV